MARIILISGKAEHGKTTAGKIFKSHFDSLGMKVTFTPFASYLKFIAKEHYGWNGKKDSEGRNLLQYIGTDVVRKKNPDFWVNTTINFIDTFEDEFGVFIADDVRFPNEIIAMDGSKHEVITVKIVRLNFESSLDEIQKQHASETSLDDWKNFDFEIKSESGLANLELNIAESILTRARNSGYMRKFFEIKE